MDDATATSQNPKPKAAKPALAAPGTVTVPANREGLRTVREHLHAMLADGRSDEALVQFMGLLSHVLDDNTLLQKRLDALLRGQYGSKSEKISVEQLALEFEKHAKQPADPETMDADPGAPDPELRPDPPPPPGPKPPPPQRRPGRNKLPEHLPHRHIDLKVPDADRACPQCGKQRGCIGHETSEQLDFVPSSLVVNVYSREKLACDNLDCNGNVVIAAKAGKVIDGGLAGAGMLAHVLVSKYEDHLPLYRQAEICQRSGIDVSDTTLCSWVAQMCAERLLGRLARCIWQQALRCSLIGADDTRLPTLDAEHEKGIKKAHLWQYLGYDELGRPQWPAFRYTEDWSKVGPQTFLSGFNGTLQGDGYAGWASAAKALGMAMVIAGCWAHARRKFVEAQQAGEKAAAEPLAAIQKMYAIEARARELGQSPEQRRQVRQRDTKPLVDKLEKWCAAKGPILRPSSKLYAAHTYLTNQWTSLLVFLDDGRLPIDNNLVENRMRPIGVGRRNYLFAGSDAGGERAAVAYTVLAACDVHGREPWAYVRDVLGELARRDEDAPVEDLLPDRWGPKRKVAEKVA